MEENKTIDIDVSRTGVGLKGARLGFFEHPGLGKYVRVSDIDEESKKGIRIEFCTENYLRRHNMSRKIKEYRRWPEHPAGEFSIEHLIRIQQDYDPDRPYQAFEIL